MPHIYIDGLIDGGSGGPWEQMMLDRRAVSSPLTIAVTGELFTGTTGEISAEITNTSGGTVSGTLHFVLIEDALLYGGKTFNYTMRDFFPAGTEGEPLSLGPGGSTSITHPFTLNVAWVRQNMEVIVFVQNDANKEVYQTGRIFFELDQPKILVNALIIDDSVGGDGNGRLDPGESATLICELGNVNPTSATGVSGTLASTNAHVTIVDGSGTWPDLPYGVFEQNDADPFVISIDENTPWGFDVVTSLELSANGRAYVDTLTVAIPIGSPNHPIGPDGYGYYAYEEGDAYPPAPTYNWIEIDPALGGPGALFTLTDDQTRRIDLPFPFKYYGTNYTRISICSNGWVALGDQTDSSPGNGPIPGPDGPPNMVAAFWTDLNPAAAGGGKVYTYYDATNGLYIVEFNGVRHYGTATPETFETILYNPAVYPTHSGDGEIVIQYRVVTDASGCTAGIENTSETIGIQYLALGQLNSAANGLAAGRAIKYTTAPPNAGAVGDELWSPQVIMLRARPNPVLGGTKISYDLPVAGDVTLRVFNLEGALVRTLLNGHAEAGPGSVSWDRTDDHGRDVSAGVYFYRLSGSGFEVNRKIVVQR